MGIIAGTSYEPRQDADLVAMDLAHLISASVTKIAYLKQLYLPSYCRYFIDELLKRARLRLYYGMDTEAMQDIEKVKTINPYALYLHGFYGTEGYIELIDKDPVSDAIELTLEQRMENYEEFFQDEMNARILDEVPGLRLRRIVDLITAERFNEAIAEIEAYTENFLTQRCGNSTSVSVSSETLSSGFVVPSLNSKIAIGGVSLAVVVPTQPLTSSSIA